jgi:hypothetical protein
MSSLTRSLLWEEYSSVPHGSFVCWVGVVHNFTDACEDVLGDIISFKILTCVYGSFFQSTEAATLHRF